MRLCQRFLRCVKVPNNAFELSFVLKLEKQQWKRINYCSKHTVKMQRVVHKCLTGSIDLKKGPQVRRKTKVMLLAFFDSEGIVYHEYTPNGQTINKEFYLEVLRCLHESVRPKRPEKWQDGDWIPHNNNAPVHTSHLLQQFLAKHSTAQLQQPSYSPDLTPCDFFLFSRHKKVLKGHWFEAMEDIKRNSTKTLLDIPKQEFATFFQQWQQRWAKCVAAEGNYVEDN